MQAMQENNLKPVGVLGGGIMGAGIAAAFLRKNVPVIVYDIAPNAREMVERNLRREDVSGAAFTDTLSDLSSCRLIIESVIEKAEVKQALLQQVEALVSPDCIIGTNTSTIPIGSLSPVLKKPDRFCGIHFLHPVKNRKLTELVRGWQTAESTLIQVDEILKQIGQIPLWVQDCPGFVVNRLLQPYLNHALVLLQEGASMEQIDQAAVNFGMAWGPIKTMDEIGIDTTFNAGRVLYSAFPDRISVSPILVSMYKSKCWGVKSGQGFRVWDGSPRNGKAEKWKMWVEEKKFFSEKEIILRLIRPMWEEGQRILEEKIVDSPAKIRIAACDGLAFPKEKGKIFTFSNFQLE